MKREPEFFGDIELVLLYIAKKLDEALALEKVLTEADVDYAVEADRYRGGFLFPSERVGAFFYVNDAQYESARQAMTAKGYKTYTPAAEP